MERLTDRVTRTIQRSRLEMLIIGLAMVILAMSTYDSAVRSVGEVTGLLEVTASQQLAPVKDPQELRITGLLLAAIFILYMAISGLVILWHFATNKEMALVPYLFFVMPLPFFIILTIQYATSLSSSWSGIVIMFLAFALVLVAIVYRIPVGRRSEMQRETPAEELEE